MANYEQMDLIPNDDSSEQEENLEKESKDDEKLTDADRRRKHIKEVQKKGLADFDNDRSPYDELTR